MICKPQRFTSVLATLLEELIKEKRACGYKYKEGERLLLRIDKLVVSAGLTTIELPKAVVEQWITKTSHEAAATQQVRVTVIRHLGAFLVRRGYAAHIVDSRVNPIDHSAFAPRILTRGEIQQLFNAADSLIPTARSPSRHLTIPEILRLLYGCGLRLSEVLRLRIQDVDLDHGVLRIHQTKFAKDRLVPFAPSLTKRLKLYSGTLEGCRSTDAPFFPSRGGGSYTIYGLYAAFRTLLHRSQMAHGGRGKGPRLHDIRHTFAVHNLIRWYREGADLNAKLPLLATYMGHQSIAGTQQYLHLTVELFPEIASRLNLEFGDVVPGSSVP